MPLQTTKISTSPNGLITEFPSILFPENATVDELNCVIDNNGKLRRRRFGFETEANGTLSSYTLGTGVVSETIWENVGGVADLSFLVLQVGQFLRFYDLSVLPLSDGEKSFTVNLASFSAGNGIGLGTNTIQADILDGVLVVAHPGTDLFYISYRSGSDSISSTRVRPRIRDFEYQTSEIETLSSEVGIGTNLNAAERYWDTINSGWSTSNIDAYNDERNRMPPLTHFPYTGKNTSGVFDVTTWRRNLTGTSLSGNGRYIRTFFSIGRSTSKFPDVIPREIESSRFNSVAAFAGRFFYAGLNSAKHSGRILFTKTITQRTDYEICHQVADPTSEIDPLLVDSDGGTININECYGIKKLFVYGNSLLVFAENGIWSIAGPDGVFKATEFFITKVSSTGLLNRDSFVDTEGTPFWWGSNGIYTFEEDRVTLQPTLKNLTESSIKSFFEDITPQKRVDSKGIYDRDTREVFWLYQSNDETLPNKFNKFLVFSLDTASFTPWEVNDEVGSTTNYITGGFFNPFLSSVLGVDDVSVNEETVTVSDELVTVTNYQRELSGSSKINFVVRDKTIGQVTFGGFTSRTFLDWGNTDFESHFIPTPTTFNSWALEKSPLFLFTYFERTEQNFVSESGNWVFDFPSGCSAEMYIDDSITPTATQDVYRFTRPFYVDEDDLTFNYPFETVINKTRLRGRGKILKIKFKSQTGKDFRLQGFELTGWANDQL